LAEKKDRWFSRRKKEYPTDKDWTFPDIESAFKAMQRDMKDKQKEITKANQHIPTYFGSLENRKTVSKRHFIQGYKITTGPDGKTKITKFGNKPPRPLKPNIQPTKEPEPLLDIIQTKKDILVVIELPRIMIKELKIIASRSRLIITAKRPNGLFSKEINLPSNINKIKSSAIYKNGVLTITLPKEK
jgi:HSP20 family molecular chaperone IbpA